MTAPLPDAVGVVERLTYLAEEMGYDGQIVLALEAAALIQSQAARIAELEAGLHAAVMMAQACVDWDQENLNACEAPWADEPSQTTRWHWEQRLMLSKANLAWFDRQARSLLSEGEGT